MQWGNWFTNNFQGRKCMGIYFFTYLRLTKLLCGRMPYLMHPDFVFIKTVFIK